MDTKAYIESGILERYALGDADAAECREVERNAARFPDVKAELVSIRATLETYATAHSVRPPSRLKSQIWERINAEVNRSGSAVASNGIAEKTAVGRDTKIIDIGRYKTMLAAASIALLVSLGANFYLYSRWNETSSRLSSLQSEQTELAKQFDVKRASLEQTQQQLALIAKPSVRPVTLQGTPANADALATVYWDKTTNDVFLLANRMAPPPSDKQYQLWAIVDGKPVDAGVFDVGAEAFVFQKMKSFPQAQAFAVTVEPRGGSATPTLTTMVVVGNT